MPRPKKYDAQIGPVPITSPMLEHLQHLAGLKRKPLNDLVRTALREYLDNQGEVAGSRRWFTQQFRETVEDGFRVVNWQLVLLTILVAEGLSVLAHLLLRDPEQAQAYTVGKLLERAEKTTVDKGWRVYERAMTTVDAAFAVSALEHDDRTEG